MSARSLLPAEAETLFGEADWDAVQNLLGRFSERQLWWLSGYLAGSVPREDAGAPAEAGTGSLLIAFGSETGNCRVLAKRLFELARERGMAAKMLDLAQAKPRQLAKEGALLLICSTHGEGDPPETAARFYDELSKLTPGTLARLKYAVLSLGDSSYDKFCQTGKDLDGFLASAGAQRLMQRLDCDVDYERAAGEWMEAALARAAEHAPAAPAPAARPHLLRPVPAARVHDKQNPYEAEVLGRTALSHSSRQGGFWHLELAADAKLEIQPGDAIGVFPLNDPALADEILELGSLAGDAAVETALGEMSLRDALLRHYDLVIPGKGLLEKWALWNAGEALREVCGGDALAQRKFLKSLQVKDLMQWFPAAPSPQEFVEQLRPLQPRLYDVANYDGDRPGEVQLTVQHYQYWINRRRESGTGSRFLTGVAPGAKVRIFAHANQRFHLPRDPGLPLVLIAVGTGIAPYRAFVQKMRDEGSPRPCWVVFQEMRYEEDFLYQLEWQEALRDGAISAFDGVFLNDAPAHSLARALLAQPSRLRDWLDQGAHVYLAGDRQPLLDCEAALAAWLGKEGPSSSRGAAWKELVKQGRIHKNLY